MNLKTSKVNKVKIEIKNYKNLHLALMRIMKKLA